MWRPPEDRVDRLGVLGKLLGEVENWGVLKELLGEVENWVF